MELAVEMPDGWRPLFAEALSAAAEVVAAIGALREFVPWPDNPAYAGLLPDPVPAAAQVAAWPADPASPFARLHTAINAIAPAACWRQTYRQDEVGADFLARYGYFELIGPTGHFHDETMRAYVAYWGAGLNYDWHLHEAEEAYFVIAGSAQFMARGQQDVVLSAGGWRIHASNEPHAMITYDQPVLTLVLWRGNGLDAESRLGAA